MEVVVTYAGLSGIGHEHSSTVSVTVVAASSEPPVANAGGPYLGAINALISLDGSASHDLDGDPLTYGWTADGGDLVGAASPTPSFTADTSGIYSVTLEVCDTSAQCDSADSTVTVFDPSGGFVTGGGWIDSPPGACGPEAPVDVCVGDPTGRATFGFVSKYKKGATVPTGATAFAFQAGGFAFASDSYDWLVVAGQDRAQFKGRGWVNDEDGYRFLLTAFDGGRDEPDGFRIKIVNDDGVVYDNMAGMAGTDDALTQGNTQTIGGGNIVIHRK
jgi:hypothetical protein